MLRVDTRERNVGAEAIDDQAASANQSRFLSSVALLNAEKLTFAASCSAIDAMSVSDYAVFLIRIRFGGERLDVIQSSRSIRPLKLR